MTIVKRYVRLLALFGLLGAVANIGLVIAVCALQRRWDFNSDIARADTPDGVHLRVERQDARFTTVLSIHRHYGSSYGPPQGDVHEVVPSWGRGYLESTSPEVISATQQAQYAREEIVAMAIGWPMRAGWYESHRAVNNRRVAGSNRPAAAQVASGTPVFIIRFDRALPTRVIWPGFIINSALFGLVLYLLLVINPLLRRAVRLRRGLCPTCAYQVGESPICTECGCVIPPGNTTSERDNPR